MAVQFIPLPRWNPKWGGAAGLAGLAGLALAGQSGVALVALAGTGAAGCVLLAAGQLKLGRAVSPLTAALPQMLDAMPAAIAVTDRSGRVVWRAQAFVDALGVTAAGSDLSRLGEGQPETAAAMFRLFSAARAGTPRKEALALAQVRGGAPFLLEVSPYLEHGKRAAFFIWHVAAGGRGHAIGAPCGNALDGLPLPALLLAKDLTVEDASKSFETLIGRPAIGAEVWTLFRTRRGKPFTRAWLRDAMARGGEPVAVQIPCSMGSPRAALLYGGPGRGESILCLVALEGASPSLDGSFSMLLARAPSPLALINTKGVIQAANDAFRELFCGSGVELCGKSLSLLVADMSGQNVQDRIASLEPSSQGGEARPIELQAMLKGPESRPVHLAIFPTGAGGGLIVSASPSGAPQLSGEQAAQNQKLQAVGELAGGIAHDFNNLLTSIMGHSDLLLRRFRASDPAFKDLMNIKTSAMRAAELVKQILAYSRKQTLRPALFKLTDVIEQFQATMGRTLGETVRASVRHGRDLWFVKADEGQIFQVVMNLVMNARDAMPDGGEISIATANVSERQSLELKARGLERGEYVMCEVRDTGTGIKPEHLEKIFDPFFSTKEVGKGTGLGLSTVYGIVKQTGGTILVDSKIGAGTAFRIYLPRHAETAEDLIALESRAEAPGRNADLTGSGTVLLVEDEDAVRSLASRALATRGYTVLEAGSGLEALAIMDRERGQVDLVLSDVVMPGMDGPTLLRHLRQRNPGIKIVFMSGYAEEAFRKNLSPGEDFVFLPKPFTLKALAETVKAAAA